MGAHHAAMKRTVVWLTDEQTKALREMSEKSLAPVSALVRQAVREFLGKKKTKQKFSNGATAKP